MRIEIKTGGKPVRNNDVRALYLIDAAMKISTPRMRGSNLRFVYDKLIHGNYEKRTR